MKYSVVIPSYNNAKYLPESLESALNQTISPSEVLVIDDGSTDNTEDIIKKYIIDSRVKYIRTENRGVSAARNKGIEFAQANLIAFLDADDVWHKNKMELQLPLFNKKKVGVVYSLRRPFDEKGPIMNYKHVSVFRGNILTHLMRHNIICLSSAVVRRECFNKTGLFNNKLTQGEDMDLWLRIAAEGYEFDYVDEALVDYRIGGAASSPQRFEKRFRDNKIMFVEFFSNPKYKERITINMRRYAWAAHWRKYGYILVESDRRIEALKYGIASLCLNPICKMAWGVVVKSLIGRGLLYDLLRRKINKHAQ